MFQSAILVVWKTDRQIQQGLNYEGPTFDMFELAVKDAERQAAEHPPKKDTSSLRLAAALVRNAQASQIDLQDYSGAVFEPGPTGRTVLMSKSSFSQLADWLTSS